MALEVTVLNSEKVCLHQTSSKKKIHMSLGLLFDVYAHNGASGLQQQCHDCL